MFGFPSRNRQKKDAPTIDQKVVVKRYIKFPKRLADLDESYGAMLRELAKR